MPRKLERNLLRLTNFKPPLPPESSSPDGHRHHNHSRDPVLVKNHNPLYDCDTLDSNSMPLKSHLTSSLHSSPPSSEPDFATIFASQRFFFPSPGLSNSITESRTPSLNNIMTTSSAEEESSSNNIPGSPSKVVDSCISTIRDSVAVPTYSPDPYRDFRRSMQEMVEARGLVDVRANWDSLHELLLCYLALNPKSTHKFIVGAFDDLLSSLLSSTATTKEKGRGQRLNVGLGGGDGS